MTASPAATTASPTATDMPTNPDEEAAAFYNLYFGLSGESLPQPLFPQGTEEVFAIWNYLGMTADDVVRRVWAKDGAEWLVREEPWDVTTYGSAGVVRDISVYDFEGAGLEPGSYELTLTVNGVFQAAGAFEIRPQELQASHGVQTVWVEEGQILMATDGAGNQREVLRTGEIAELLWMPDGQRLVYVTMEAAEPGGPPWPDFIAWMVDVESGQPQALSPVEQRVRRVAAAEGGRYLSALAGTDFGDACGMDRSLLFLDLSAANGWFGLEAFDSVLNERPYGFFPADAGQWVSDHEFEVNMSAYCLGADIGTPAEDLALLGRYRFDLETMTAVGR